MKSNVIDAKAGIQAAGSRFHCDSGILPLKGVCGRRALDPKNVQPPDSRESGNLERLCWKCSLAGKAGWIPALTALGRNDGQWGSP